jgi:uncharacterized protein
MIKQFVYPGFCLSCQGCCRFKQKDSVWSPHLLKSEEVFGQVQVKNIPAVSGEGFVCASLDIATSKCKIYQNRPFECQLYPFLFNLNSGKSYLAVDLGCPFARDNFGNNYFNEYAGYLEDFFNTPEQKSLLKLNPQLFQSYELVKDLFELPKF